MKPPKYILKIIDVLTVICLLGFFASFGFKDSRMNGWYQQFFPNMNGSTIASLTFLDSLTGYAVTSTNSSLQAYILKTTNGGDNWNVIYTYVPAASTVHFAKIQFANSNIGYASTNYIDFFKTTNAGLNWVDLTIEQFGDDDMAVINVDTILCVSSSGFYGGVYRSTNGGLSWQALGQVGGSGQPSKIYMFNKDIGFKCLDDDALNPIYKTTNGGVNWFTVTGGPFHDIKFFDSLTGWKTLDSIKKTTDGGISWTLQQIPYSNLFFGGHSKISIANIDSLWLVGGYKLLNGNYYGIIYRATDGGTSWGYQLPDTSYHIGSYHDIKFVNAKIGWAFSPEVIQTVVHTVTGGDSTIYMGVNNNITSVPKDYVLFQNYPNPFNPVSSIKYQVSRSSNVKLVVYNITGKEITTLVNEKKYSGTYEVSFDGSNLSSGVYFYTLFVNGVRVDTKKAILIK